MQLLFGSYNAHKVAELRAILAPRLGADFQLLSCADFALLPEVAETGTTLEANALLKAQGYFDATGVPCFADDTGLEVTALDGAPGVYSARYGAAPGQAQGDAQANMVRLLRELAPHPNRQARFRTVICLVGLTPQPIYFEGELVGKILHEPRGNHGFGYDPIFIPAGFDQTLAEMSPDEKNQISHRKLAVARLADWLWAQNQ